MCIRDRHIRRAGDGGDAQVSLGGQGDAQGHDEERHDQDEAAPVSYTHL